MQAFSMGCNILACITDPTCMLYTIPDYSFHFSIPFFNYYIFLKSVRECNFLSVQKLQGRDQTAIYMLSYPRLLL